MLTGPPGTHLYSHGCSFSRSYSYSRSHIQVLLLSKKMLRVVLPD